MIFMLSNISTSIFIGFASQIISLQYITAILGLTFIFVAIYYKKFVKIPK